MRAGIAPRARALVCRYRPQVQKGWSVASPPSRPKPAVGRHRNSHAVRNAERSGAAPSTSARRGAARQADQELAALCEAHYRALTKLAALLVGDLAAAEDIVQDAFVAMHRTWRALRTGDQTLLYLRREVIRRARSRRPARRGTAAQTPQSQMPGSQAAPRVLAILATLPTRQREVLILRYWAGLSATQIAAVTGSRPQAVTRSIAKGLVRLAPAGQSSHDDAPGRTLPDPAGRDLYQRASARRTLIARRYGELGRGAC